ncbi:uncharacterized protein BJ171DRAFT_600008 [Polychytrium aggregatum]|uniref:uncharacterized protein n=1 Tax=Polychytrium aggregatum TaxID=110093 RepID=UPI0022FEE1F7|nr:uncharacterized protein BJ171DRAFT_600008 [Polychytrium aggregatum]KAI9203445.1 hypothetical protein BJ171DRAFT_600008 [Polychytrium aggregatum]
MVFSIQVSGGQAFVWNPTDIMEMRSRYRIVGALLGTLPRQPMQNDFFSLPLLLMPEEVSLLLSKGLALLTDGASLHRPPSEDEKQQHDRQEAEAIQNYEHEKKKVDAQRRLLSKEIALHPSASKAAGAPTSAPDTAPPIHPADIPTPKFPIIIRTTSTGLPWYGLPRGEPQAQSPEKARASGLWVWPSTAAESLKLKVYGALWDQGYFITSGSKFGGDYLMYQGDPLRFHSSFIVLVVPRDKLFSAMDCITFGRLGTVVKKTYVVCSWDEEHDKLISHSIRWTGWN